MSVPWRPALRASLTERLPRALARAFAPRALPWHALAILLTAALVLGGIDWSWLLLWRGTLGYTLLVPAVGLLNVGILIAIGTLLLLAYRRDDARLLVLALALAEAAVLGLMISSGYKAFTGRLPPPRRSEPLTDLSQGFRFGFLRGGLFWGWPSSHTTIATATATTLVRLTPRRRWVHVAAFAFAAYIAIGVSVSIHWLSDVVAGACIGPVIGLAVASTHARLDP